jgi:hypothetical protein
LDLKVKSKPRTGVDKNDEESNMPSKNSQLDLKVKSEPAIDKNDEESDNNNHNESDSDSNLSTYTNAHTYDKDSLCTWIGNEATSPSVLVM